MPVGESERLLNLWLQRQEMKSEFEDQRNGEAGIVQQI